MYEVLKAVLDRFLLKKYPEIHHIYITTLGMGNIYKVDFYVTHKIGNQIAYEIMDEATGLFYMLGPEKAEDIIIGFELYKSPKSK